MKWNVNLKIELVLFDYQGFASSKYWLEKLKGYSYNYGRVDFSFVANKAPVKVWKKNFAKSFSLKPW